MELPPPSYEQVVTTQNPYGKPEDIAFAHTILQSHSGHTQVLGAWGCGEENIQKLTWGQVKIMAFMPCFWPMMPCVIPSAFDTEERLRKTWYILTDSALVIAVHDFKSPCCPCCTSGQDYREIPYEYMLEVSVNNIGQGCSCWQVPRVHIVLPGVREVGSGDDLRLVQNEVDIIAENVNQVADIIRNARKSAKNAAKTVVVTQQPAPGMVTTVAAAATAPGTLAQPKRIFVAHAQNRGAFQVVMATTNDMYAFTILASDKLGVKGGLRFELDDVGVPISSLEEVQNNDKLIAFPM